MRSLLRILVCAWILSLAPRATARQQVDFASDGLAVLVEDRPLSIEEVIQYPEADFKPTHSLRPNMGFNSKTHWFYCRLGNTSMQAAAAVFEVAYPRLERLDFYAVDASGQVVARFLSGTETAADARPISHMNFAFPLDLAAGESLRIYIRVYTTSPLRFPVKIWESEPFRTAQQSQMMMQGLYFGGISIMVIYNMFVFFSTRNRSYLFYCLFVGCTAFYLASDGGLLLHYVFTDSSFFNNKITLLTIDGANIFGILFVSFFMDLKANDPLIYRQIRWILAVQIVSLGTVFILPYAIVGITFTLFSTFSSVLLITMTVRGLMRRQREAYFYAAAWACLLVGTFAYGLLALGFIDSNFFTERGLQLGSLFEVTILSFALADRLNQLRLGLKDANARLAYQIEHVEEQVLIKTRDIRSIMEHVPLGIFSIVPGLLVHRDYSKSMETLFHKEHIEGALALDILFDHALISADQKNQMAAALIHVIGEDIVAFHLNRHCFVDQVIMEHAGVRGIFNLLWNPVCNEAGLVEKVLVTVHDSTRLLALEEEAETQKQELATIQRILEVPALRFQSFLRQASRLLIECRDLLHSERDLQETRRMLLMNIHTLKGTARSLFFDKISNLCHMVEERSYQASREAMIEDIRLLMEAVEHYKTIAVEKLGRRLGRIERLDVKTSLLKGVIQDLTRKTQVHLRELESLLYRPLAEVLADCLKSSARLADELGKARPGIIIEAEGFGVTQEGYDALIGLITHLLRNSLDHGLEDAGTRRSKGKNPEGTIQLRAHVEGQQLLIEFADDGSGLAIQELKKMGLKQRLLHPAASLQEIAELIFVPELSTSQTISMVSGRGVGLSAVRTILQKEGGDVRLILPKAQTESEEFQAFYLQLCLPPHYWIRFQGETLALSA